MNMFCLNLCNKELFLIKFTSEIESFAWVGGLVGKELNGFPLGRLKHENYSHLRETVAAAGSEKGETGGCSAAQRP